MNVSVFDIIKIMNSYVLTSRKVNGKLAIVCLCAHYSDFLTSKELCICPPAVVFVACLMHLHHICIINYCRKSFQELSNVDEELGKPYAVNGIAMNGESVCPAGTNGTKRKGMFAS